MEIQNRNVFLFNAGAGAIIFFGLIAFLKSVFLPADPEPCSTRFHTATMLGVTNGSGAPASSQDMQIRLGFRAWGVADFMAVERSSKAPGGMAMRVALPKGSRSPGKTDEPSGGMGFHWQPGFLKNASSACLSFAIELPKDFPFHRGGKLPGLFGSAPDARDAVFSDHARSGDSFTTNFKWNREGAGAVAFTKADPQSGASVLIGDRSFNFERGRWIRLEQEIILNSPGRRDGLLRVWIDGELAFDRDDMLFRKSAGGRIAGVVADTHYASQYKGPGAPADSWIRMTPFILGWQ